MSRKGLVEVPSLIQQLLLFLLLLRLLGRDVAEQAASETQSYDQQGAKTDPYYLYDCHVIDEPVQLMYSARPVLCFAKDSQ